MWTNAKTTLVEMEGPVEILLPRSRVIALWGSLGAFARSTEMIVPVIHVEMDDALMETIPSCANAIRDTQDIFARNKSTSAIATLANMVPSARISTTDTSVDVSRELGVKTAKTTSTNAILILVLMEIASMGSIATNVVVDQVTAGSIANLKLTSVSVSLV